MQPYPFLVSLHYAVAIDIGGSEGECFVFARAGSRKRTHTHTSKRIKIKSGGAGREHLECCDNIYTIPGHPHQQLN